MSTFEIPMNQQTKFIWADHLRVAATIAVITVHVSASILPLYKQIPDLTWWTGNLFDSVSRFCVPIFVMLSGALLLPKDTALPQFFKKRLSRLIYPFLFWCVVYIVHYFLFYTKSIQTLSANELYAQLVDQIKYKVISYHFWYIYMIIGLYLAIPFMGKWIRKARESALLYFLGVWLVGLLLLENVGKGVEINHFIRYIGYLVLGYYLSRKEFSFNTAKVALILIVTGILITAVGTYILTSYYGKFNLFFYGYTSPNVILFASGVFLYFKSLKINPDKKNKVITFINRYSYGIYLVHILILTHLKISWRTIHPLLGIPLTVVCCLLISSLVIYVINKIPGGKYISG
ncbi:acyltransferase [Arcticibacter eurypsychrophilus]|uniref:acyltransferase n=1 Tax=Arcticibacter eurypsychrophilus TaxID=1434752 RepID=UPI00084D57D3|nr:acyltransferase family protein [Arcticibacter eurypsychrophilus]